MDGSTHTLTHFSQPAEVSSGLRLSASYHEGQMLTNDPNPFFFGGAVRKGERESITHSSNKNTNHLSPWKCSPAPSARELWPQVLVKHRRTKWLPEVVLYLHVCVCVLVTIHLVQLSPRQLALTSPSALCGCLFTKENNKEKKYSWFSL